MKAKIANHGRFFISDPFGCVKLSGDAELPRRKNEQDPFFSVSCIARTKGRTSDETGRLSEFKTGLSFILPPHYHLEVMGSPSLAQAGYYCPGVKVITTKNMKEELIVELIKFDDQAPDLDLSFEAVIFFIRESEFAEFNFVAVEKKARAKKAPAVREDSSEDESPAVLLPANGKGRKGGNHHF